MKRRTKIVCTLGPATDAPETLEKLLLAGANVLRFNFSHGDAEDHRKRAKLVRTIAAKHQLNVAILGDLQGPKIRIARFRDGRITLEPGANFTLDAGLDKDQGDSSRVGLDYEALPDESSVGDTLLLDDGRLVLEVESVEGRAVHCLVRTGGVLSNNKGINRQGGGLSAAALTEKDMADIKLAAEIDVDYLAVSFPRSPEDLVQARSLLRDAGGHAGIVAKIERAEAVSDLDNLDQLIEVSDAVMVARGDLGVEIGDAELVGVQKHIISRARELNRVVITATQMMETMIKAPLPSRAEVFDVANAVLDGTDAVMLSAETAAGDYPVEAVEAMSRVCVGAEKQPASKISDHRVNLQFERTDEAIAMATMYIANHLHGVKAIICLTESGYTPLWMSRIRSGLPIFAFSQHPKALRRVLLYRGVEPIFFDHLPISGSQVDGKAIEELKLRGIVETGDRVLLTKGDQMGVPGATNVFKILDVP